MNGRCRGDSCLVLLYFINASTQSHSQQYFSMVELRRYASKWQPHCGAEHRLPQKLHLQLQAKTRLVWLQAESLHPPLVRKTVCQARLSQAQPLHAASWTQFSEGGGARRAHGRARLRSGQEFLNLYQAQEQFKTQRADAGTVQDSRVRRQSQQSTQIDIFHIEFQWRAIYLQIRKDLPLLPARTDQISLQIQTPRQRRNRQVEFQVHKEVRRG